MHPIELKAAAELARIELALLTAGASVERDFDEDGSEFLHITGLEEAGMSKIDFELLWREATGRVRPANVTQ